MILVLACDPARRRRTASPSDADGRAGRALPRSPTSVRRSLVRRTRASARIFFAAGRRARARAGARRRFFIEAATRAAHRRADPVERRFTPGKVSVSSAHLMGGCGMGAAPADSVTDALGTRARRARGSSSPTRACSRAALEINPYLTIMALADRVAERVRGATWPRLQATRHDDRRGRDSWSGRSRTRASRFAFGIPGTHNIELYDALGAVGEGPAVLVTDEQSAGVHGRRRLARVGAARRASTSCPAPG